MSDDNSDSNDNSTRSTDQNGGNGEDNGDNDVIKVKRTGTSPAVLSQLQRGRLFQQARGLGAGGTGAIVWRAQRLTALALIPLVLWFMVSVVYMSTQPRADIAAWLAYPVNAVLMALFIVIGLRHGVIGIGIVMEDYVANDTLRSFWMLLIKAAALVLGVAVIAALIVLATA